MNGYDLTSCWYEFKFSNPDKVRAIHSDFYFYVVYMWNKLGQTNKIGLPTAVTMQSLGIGSYNTYKSVLNDLIDFGFINLIASSKNQHQSKIVALSKIDKATDKALALAISISDKPSDEPTDKATDTIIEYINKEIDKYPFSDFWSLYGKPNDKSKASAKWEKLRPKDKEIILKVLPIYVKSTPDRNFRKNAITWLNGKCWLDDYLVPVKNDNELKPLENNDWK